MKKSISILVVILFVITSSSLNAACFDYCEYGDCEVNFYQGESAWGMDVQCGDQSEATSYWGSGQYEGTICGGYSPCSDMPMEN